MTEDVLIDAFASWYSHQYEGQAEEAREFLRELKAEAWDEGRASVGEQMLQPRDEYGMFPPVANPYRGGQ
ncbi:UNVERIFIED_CONTAM: hypothetical protein IGO34_22750 [Salmonella enterica subsp. enterica serovar Weltevreden]